MAKKKRQPAPRPLQPAETEQDLRETAAGAEETEDAALTAEKAEPAAEDAAAKSGDDAKPEAEAKPEKDEASEEDGKSGKDEKPAAEKADKSGGTKADEENPEEEQYSFKTLVHDAKNVLARYDLPNLFLTRFIALYFLLAGFWVVYLRHKFDFKPVDNWRDFVPQVSAGSMLVCSVIFLISGFMTLSSLHGILPKKARVVDQALAIASVLFFDIAMLWRVNNFYMSTAVAFVSLVFIYYAVCKLPSRKPFESIPWWLAGVIVLGATVAVTLFIAIGTVRKHQIFGTACHDFGLFVQMFHYLAKGVHAYTTCERDTLLSHFNIHSSYIYYLLVPFYKLIPKAGTLLVSQAILAMGGIVPTFLIAKRHKLKGAALIFLCFAYTFSLCLVSPCFYDFHENAFLPTLLMWLFWAIDRRSTVFTWIFTVLVCIVKEDAPLYTACIGLFIFFEMRKRKEDSSFRWQGLIMTALSGIYLLFITRWLTAHGDGSTMTATRFGNLMIDPSGGLLEVVKNVILDPAYFISLLVHEETLPCFLQVMLPLLFLPFATKKIHRYWRMIPFIVMNLCIGAGYGYAASIDYHYVFGPFCLLLYSVILNLDDMGEEKKHDLAVLLGSAALIFFIGMPLSKWDSAIYYKNGKEGFEQVEAVLDRIPKDATVAAGAFFVSHCADRDYVYLFDFGDTVREENRLIDPDRYDYIVYGPTGELGEFTTPILESLGWTKVDGYESRVVVYKNPNYAG